jgi:hypothetical protein
VKEILSPFICLMFFSYCDSVASAAGNRLATKINYVRRTASGAAGNGPGTTIKYLRRTRNGVAGAGLGTTIKWL